MQYFILKLDLMKNTPNQHYSKARTKDTIQTPIFTTQTLCVHLLTSPPATRAHTRARSLFLLLLLNSILLSPKSWALDWLESPRRQGVGLPHYLGGGRSSDLTKGVLGGLVCC